MGAAASMKHLYQDSLDWFKLYFDRMSYREDFSQLNANHDGVVTFEMVQSWIHHKAKDGTFWNQLVSSESIMRIAFDVAVKKDPEDTTPAVLNLASFREFLVHLFVLSILWVHFKHAEEWTEGADVTTERLTFLKFKMACRTFTAANAHEHVSDEKLQEDFEFLDINKNGSIEFTEVCKYCANFFNKDFANRHCTQETAAMARKTHIYNEEEHPHDKSMRYIRTVRMASTTTTAETANLDPETAAQVASEVLHTGSAKAHKAMDVIGEKMEANAKVATFEEIKISTEIQLGISLA